MGLYIMWSKWADDLICLGDVVIGCGLCKGYTIKKGLLLGKISCIQTFTGKNSLIQGEKLEKICTYTKSLTPTLIFAGYPFSQWIVKAGFIWVSKSN